MSIVSALNRVSLCQNKIGNIQWLRYIAIFDKYLLQNQSKIVSEYDQELSLISTLCKPFFARECPQETMQHHIDFSIEILFQALQFYENPFLKKQSKILKHILTSRKNASSKNEREYLLDRSD